MYMCTQTCTQLAIENWQANFAYRSYSYVYVTGPATIIGHTKFDKFFDLQVTVYSNLLRLSQ